MTMQLLVDETRINQFYEEMSEMVVNLEEEFNPQGFNRKSVLIRTHMDRISTITSQLTGDLHRVSRHLLRIKKIFELERDNLLTSNMLVRAEHTHAAKLARVSSLLQTEIREINELEMQKEDLERMLGLVKVKLQDLHNTQSSLRDQRKVFELIHANGRGLPAVPETAKKLEEDLDALLANMASPVSTLTSVEGLLDTPHTGEDLDDLSNTELSIEQMLEHLPTLEQLKQKQRT